MAAVGSFCATLGSERAAGSELAKTETMVATDGNELVVTGEKFFSTNTDFADFLVVIARRTRDHCMTYAKSKPFRDGVLVDSPVFAQRLGQMEMQIDVMKSHCLRAARDYDAIMAEPNAAALFHRQGTLKSALTAKMFCGQAGWEAASVGSEMFGGLGYTEELPIGKLMRDMRYVSIVEGGDDVLRDLLFGRYVIPVPRRS